MLLQYFQGWHQLPNIFESGLVFLHAISFGKPVDFLSDDP
jgi:hypothetical protein